MNLDETVNHVLADDGAKHIELHGTPNDTAVLSTEHYLDPTNGVERLTPHRYELTPLHARLAYDARRPAPTITPINASIHLAHRYDDANNKYINHVVNDTAPLIQADQLKPPVSKIALDHGLTEATVIDHEADQPVSCGATNTSVKRLNNLYHESQLTKPDTSPRPRNDAYRTGLNITV